MNIELWGKALAHRQILSYAEVDLILNKLSKIFSGGMSATELNDFFACNTQTIAEWLGYGSWYALYASKYN